MPARWTKSSLTKLQTTGLSHPYAYKIDQNTPGISSNYSTSDSSHASSAPSTSWASHGMISPTYISTDHSDLDSHTILPPPTHALKPSTSPARYSPTGPSSTIDHNINQSPNVVIRRANSSTPFSRGKKDVPPMGGAAFYESNGNASAVKIPPGDQRQEGYDIRRSPSNTKQRIRWQHRTSEEGNKEHKEVSSVAFPSASISAPPTSTVPSMGYRSKKGLGAHLFLVSRKVGQGGFGSVYKAMEINTGQTVAVKTVIRRGLRKERVNSTLQEQAITRRIAIAQARGTQYKGEQFVIRMVASFLTPSHFVFVLDFHGAGDLRDVDFPLSTEDARFYIAEMALGLRFVHSLGIVIRDLKPANVLLGFDGHVSLADFGLAKFQENWEGPNILDNETEQSNEDANKTRKKKITMKRARTLSFRSFGMLQKPPPTPASVKNRKRANTIGQETNSLAAKIKKVVMPKSTTKQIPKTTLCGTPGYIPPEGYDGFGGPEGDVWALGITLYEFITGMNPFDVWGVPTAEIKNKVIEAAVFYPDDMPFVTKNILEKILQKEPEDRLNIEDIMQHRFFDVPGFSWEMLANKEIPPPPLPAVSQKRRRLSDPEPSMPLLLLLEKEILELPPDRAAAPVEVVTTEETNSFHMDNLHECFSTSGSPTREAVWW